MITREIVSKPFDVDSLEPIDVVVETYDSGAVVEYRKPSPRLVMTKDKSQFLADGVDSATITVSFEECTLSAPVTETDEDGNEVVVAPAELVWTSVVPTGDVEFVVNLRPTTVTINEVGTATLIVQSTVEKRFTIRASHPTYGEAYVNVEALL